MSSTLEKIKAYREKSNNYIKNYDFGTTSALDKIKAYREANPYNEKEDINYLMSKKKRLETQLSNYDRKEKVEWWSDDNNFLENVGNVLYKTFIERQPTKYEEDENYNKLKSEYDEVNSAIQDYKISNTNYEKGFFGGVQKVADTITGNAMSSVKGMESSVNKLAGLPTNSNITYSEKLAQKAREETTGIGRVGLDLVGSFTRMLPQILAPNPITATAIGFANYGGSAYNEAKREGADETRATIYGLTIGSLEMAMSKILGGFESVYGKSALGKLSNKVLGNVIKNPTLRKTISGATGEFTEEYLQEFLEPIVRNTILQEENGADFWNTMKDDIGEGLKQLSKQFFNMENLYAGLLGGLSSSILQLPNNIAQSKFDYQSQIDSSNINSNQNTIGNANDSFNSDNTPKTVYDLVQQEQNSQNNANLPIIDNSQNDIVPYTQHEIENFKNGKVKVVQNESDISSFVDTASKVPSNAKLYFGKLGKKIANKIKQTLGINLENYNISLSTNAVRHTYKNHGKLEYENNRGQVPITSDDFKLIPQIVTNYDNVRLSGTTENNNSAIVFEKRIGDNYYLVSYVSNKNHNLEVKTMWKIKAQKKNSATASDALMPQSLTSETDSGTSSLYVNDSTNLDNSQIMQSSNNINMQNQQNNTQWQDFLEQNYKATGTRTDMRKLLPTQEDIKKMELSNIKLPIKEARKLNSQQKNNYVESKITKILNSQSYKAVNKASKVGQNYLYFNNTQKRNFKEKLMKYVGKSSNDLTNAKTWNEVKELVKEYANKDYIYVDEELKSVKNQVRSMNIKITEDLKRQITDYNDFRKENFGKLKLGNNGNTIDSVYQELSEQYPYYFGSAETQADMLYELSDFMNKDINIVEKYQFDDAYLEETTAKIFNNLMQNTLNEQQIEELRTNLEDKLNARTREVIQEELMQEMGITLDDISKGKDISSFDLSRTDPIRVNEKIFGAKVGDKINDATIRKTQANEASRIRFLNKERNEIKKLGIKAFSKESEAVQKYGEKQYINDKGDIIPYGDKELIQDFPDIITQQKIKKAAEVIRNKYDTYIDQINNVLVDMGYDAIKKRKDYMRHFQALNDVFSRFGVPLNAESLQSDSLPTDINGLTDQFKPGKQYFASAMQRIGMKTTYDAITGIDGYLEGASNLIYHTEDIQRYRALSKFIRNTYGAEHGFENVDKLPLPQQEQRIQDIQSNKLAKYVSWLDEQANALANKKGKIDRGVEEVFGRKVYKVLETAKKQVGSNMVGFNIRSALTNFASVVQGASKTNKIAFLKGTISTINNMIHKDNLVDKSDFLTRRFGSDQLSQKLWQKATNAGFALMTGTDYFTANQIWRSKYYEYLGDGLSENMAIKGADDFASRIMGDRSKGSTATLFNSKTLGFFTQFQLEVNNQWSTMIHDNKMDLQRGNKTASSIVFQLGQLFAMSYLFNNLMESLTGSDVMLDPIELLKMLFNPDDEEDMEQRATKVLGEVVNNIPFASIFTGGRIPVGEAFGGVSTAFKYATGQTDDYGNNYEVKDVANDMIESAFYWILPTGFSQLNKTRKGLSMYDENLPVKGSYTESGNLRFTADESFGGKVKATLFGQYSSKESQDYIESGFKTIPKGKINEMKSLEMNSTEYRKYREELANAGKTNEEKLDYISGLKLPISKKNIMANNVVNSDKYQIDMSKYGDFSSYEEMQMYYTNPSKYSTITQITTYAKYQNYNDAIKDIKEQYEDSNQRKYAVINYVNGLNLSIPQKAMLIKMNYNSFDNYDNQIIEYINSQNMTIAEKTEILEQLGFTVRNGRVYS